MSLFAPLDIFSVLLNCALCPGKMKSTNCNNSIPDLPLSVPSGALHPAEGMKEHGFAFCSVHSGTAFIEVTAPDKETLSTVPHSQAPLIHSVLDNQSEGSLQERPILALSAVICCL